MITNALMLVAMLVAVIAWVKVDRAMAAADKWDCVDVVRAAAARRVFRRWRWVAGIATAAYVLLWWFGGPF